MKSYLQGKLCLSSRETDRHRGRGRCRPVSLVVTTPVTPEPVVMSDPVSVIEAQLRRIDTARQSGATETAERLTESLIDYVWGPLPHGVA